MTKTPLVLVVSVVLATACTSTVEPDEACTVVGTYSLTGQVESGDCPESSGGTDSTTLTISAAEPGSGIDYVLEIQGIEGGCPMMTVESCKLQGKCDLTLKDPIDPRNATGSIQYTWTFTKSGFSGFSSLSFPPAKTLPDGCSQNATNTATRR